MIKNRSGKVVDNKDILEQADNIEDNEDIELQAEDTEYNEIDDELIEDEDLDIEPITELSEKDSTTLNHDSTIKNYYQSIMQYNPYTLEEEIELGKEIKAGNKEALKKLILANLKFVVSEANKYKYSSVPLQDLINQGNIGLIEAAKRYDYTKGRKFITYAVWWIRQSIKYALNEQGDSIKLPVKYAQNLSKINSATNKLSKEKGRAPTTLEIAEATGLAVEDIDDVLLANKSLISIDSTIGDNDNKTYHESIEDEDSNVEKIVIAKTLKKSIDEMITTLDEREYQIITQRFGFDGQPPKTLEELGEILGISRERVRQLEARALDKLKRKAIKKRLNDYLN